MKPMIAAAVLGALAGQVNAGGIAEPVTEAPVAAAPVEAPVFDWTGFYAGISIGSGTLSDDGGATDTGTGLTGVQIGYLRQFGSFVVGGEAAHVRGSYDDNPVPDWSSTRLKLIGGYAAGRFLPYAFVGVSRFTAEPASVSDTMMIYGLGARYAFGQSGRVRVGLEYLVEDKDDFAGFPDDLRNREVSLRLEYRF